MNYLWNKFFLLSRFKQIGIVVLGFHCTMILALSLNHLWSKKQSRPHPIAIRTITLPSTTAPLLTSNLTTSKKEGNTSLTKTHPPNIQKSSKATTASKLTRKPPPIATLAPNEEALLQQLSNNLDALSRSEKSSDTKFAVSIPPAIERVTRRNLDPSGPSQASYSITRGKELATHGRNGESSSFQEGVLQTTNISCSQSYGTAFTAILQNNLDLPEFGTVTAKIEIGSEGKVTALEILDARSQKNGEFLKKRLQELAFPCFNEFGLSEKHLHFTVTFRNVETY